MELFLVKPNEMIEIPTESITWSGQRYQAARKIEANIFYASTGGHGITRVEDGDTVLFKWQGTELFRGTIFNRTQSKSGMLILTAYDMLQYLLLNKDIYFFSKKRLDEILLRICKDFEIPYNVFPNTKHVLPSLPFDSETALYDIALKALVETHKAIKRKFHIDSRLGKVNLKELTEQSIQWVLEVGTNIVDYTYDTSIEETATKIKLVSGDEKQVTAIVTDEDGKKKFGVLQYFEKVSDDLTQAQLNEKAKTTLDKKKGIQKKLDIEALGITDVTSGNAVYVIISDIGVKRTYFIDQDTHSFQGNSHTMSVQLIETNDLPDIPEEKIASTKSDSSKSNSTISQSTSTKATEVVKLAQSYIGKLRYNFGGKNIAGGSGDCSGFTYFIFNKIGVNLGHGTATQIGKGSKIAKSEARTGDLVFFKGTIPSRGKNSVSHVGVVTKPGYCVSLASSGCKEHSYTSGYWRDHFMQINRVL
ncbi:XkdQ/YqbQ family protein [Peribacillus loiseleuriae]|uniref:XkdQ/YqbQ family protein n=1 Tax=Peribacillus loiseleuriae TaxID=1679170 RepID=UPI003D043CB6